MSLKWNLGLLRRCLINISQGYMLGFWSLSWNVLLQSSWSPCCEGASKRTWWIHPSPGCSPVASSEPSSQQSFLCVLMSYTNASPVLKIIYLSSVYLCGTLWQPGGHSVEWTLLAFWAVGWSHSSFTAVFMVCVEFKVYCMEITVGYWMLFSAAFMPLACFHGLFYYQWFWVFKRILWYCFPLWGASSRFL